MGKIVFPSDSHSALLRDEAKVASDDKLLEMLAGWKVDSEKYLIVKREIERRKNKWPEFRSWLSLAISVVALAVALGVALYKQGRIFAVGMATIQNNKRQ